MFALQPKYGWLDLRSVVLILVIADGYGYKIKYLNVNKNKFIDLPVHQTHRNDWRNDAYFQLFISELVWLRKSIYVCMGF